MSPVFVSLEYGEVVVGLPDPVPIGAVPIGLLSEAEEPDGVGYGAGAVSKLEGIEGDATLELLGTVEAEVEELTPVLRGMDGIAMPVLKDTEGRTAPEL